MRRRHVHSLFLATFATSIVVVGGCSPLPGASLDPVYLGGSKSGGPAAEVVTTPRAGREAAATGETAWSGRYQDSRGGGEIRARLVRGTSTLSGTWKLRTGGGGPLIATAETSAATRFQLRMENLSPECRGAFQGWVEVTDVALIGSYRGTDCEGAISDGRFELHLEQSGNPSTK